MDQRVRNIIAFMNANLDRKLTVDGLAGIVNLSASRLAHLFKQETGKSTFRYLFDLRLERARELLETTFFSVKQVAARVGQSANQFNESFKRAYGVTPGSFAARHRRTAPSSAG
jgi:AraC family transcriptional regulator of arabinose operon